MNNFLPIAEKLAHLPDSPGVYQYLNHKGEILYIGKAKSLKKRVTSYFQPSADHTLRIALMVSLVHDLQTIITNTESEALILESQLIKAHQPRYNVEQKDDKSYPYFKLTTQEMYPRLVLVREKFVRQNEYYGPYTSVRNARQVLRLINKLFLLRTSRMDLDGSRTYRPCLNFQLKRCLAPCRGNVPVEQYAEEIQQVRMFLQGKYRELIAKLQKRMYDASESLDYERAAKLRDQIHATRNTFEKQQFFSPAAENIDVFALYRDVDKAGVQVLFIRFGRLLATDFFFFEEAEQATNDNLMGQVLHRIYMGENFAIPRKIYLPFPYSDQEALARTLSEKLKRQVSILVPKRGQKRKAVEMAYQNAVTQLDEKKRQLSQNEEVLQKTKDLLHLKNLPVVIEAFDISNISGTLTVASMVVWKNGKADKDKYRKYKIQSVEGPDDFASMKEVLTRRYQRSSSGEIPWPDLILIDGGKGQLNMAIQVLSKLNLVFDQVDVIGLAKGRSEKRRGIQRDHEEDFEYVVKPNQKNEIRLNRHSAVLHLLQNIRDESHRFAITFHRSLRRKSTLHSVLDEIDGVGKHRKKVLLKHFGSLKKIRSASLEELQNVPGISEALALKITGFLKQK
ncbi:MAG: excinuclease ABC subunit UvrC [SAR324 cluster bacterium]|nr:excinuclease ABC subunit UvrC [SAR324 cluster bacterium]